MSQTPGTIMQDGDDVVCTACGTTVDVCTLFPPRVTPEMARKQLEMAQEVADILAKGTSILEHAERFDRPVASIEAPIPVWELCADGWDGVDELDSDWMQTLPMGTRLYYIGATPIAPQALPSAPDALTQPQLRALVYTAQCGAQDEHGSDWTLSDEGLWKLYQAIESRLRAQRGK